jgi:diaminohydroxyphosphoribosylaminopyrimidine deaminase/5-amino-6-(5-phosphoribosylamino)uracil reductase
MGNKKNKYKDSYYMRMAISLASRGTGNVSPNPKVGAVIVKEDEVVGFGWHRQLGGNHAEVEALAMAQENAKGATVYVNLEPCSHYGKTPPCAPRLVEAGVSRVVISMVDPNEKVNGKGISILEQAGIQVDIGIEREASVWLNRGFIKRVKTGRPWVILKAALTADGNIAMQNGYSKWITNEFSRTSAHLLRAECDAILVGAGTVIKDNPRLDVRDAPGKSPLKVVLDSRYRVPITSKIFDRGRTIIMGSELMFKESSFACYRDRDNSTVEIMFAQSENNGKVDIERVLQLLGDLGVNYLLVEGGAEVFSSFVSRRLFDEISLFINPSFMGKGIGMTRNVNVTSLEDRIGFNVLRVSNLEGDLWIEGVSKCSQDLLRM